MVRSAWDFLPAPIATAWGGGSSSFPGVPITGGGVHTAIARDGIGATPLLGLILLDGFTP